MLDKEDVTADDRAIVFQLTSEEVEFLGSQDATLNTVAETTGRKTKRGQNLKYRLYAFTEQGASMLATVIKGEDAHNLEFMVTRMLSALATALGNSLWIRVSMNKLSTSVTKCLYAFNINICHQVLISHAFNM